MRRYAALLAMSFLVGCTGPAAPSTATPPQTLFPSRSSAISPNKCNDSELVRIHRNGGAFKVPPCSGWTGTINYPPTNGSFYRLLVTSSVTNNFGAPPPLSGTAIFYMQTANHTHGRAPGFGDSGVTDTVASPQLSSNHTYTLIVYNFLADDQCFPSPSQPCPPWVKDIGAPAPSTHSIAFESPLNGADFGGAPIVWQFVQN